MHYYKVRVAGRAYHSKKPLTYSYDSDIAIGSIVSVPVRGKEMKGFITTKSKKPTFTTKQISRVDNDARLTKATIKLHEWLEYYYPSSSSSSLQLFMPHSILKNNKQSLLPPVVNGAERILKSPLRPSQKKVLESIQKSNKKAFLLHGETGSGKTRVYAELAVKTLKQRKTALILTPEIGLTTQLTSQLEELTKTKAILLHSQLTTKQRRENWKRIAGSSEGTLVVGTRSALFGPYSSLGLIVMDEAHEDAYKQEQEPHYHASRVAAQLAQIHDATLLLGTATPSVNDYTIFKDLGVPIIKMNLPDKGEKLRTEIVDITDRTQFASSPHLSIKLINTIKNALKNGEQSLVYLNRRGTARLILCQSCGWEQACPRCDIALTFHDDLHQVRCHTCGFTDSPPSFCPSCKSADIFYKQIGTKALISHIQQLLPEARVARFDTDVSKGERLEARFEEVRSGKIDILIGTQLLSKGLDLPKLSVIGIVQADSSLSFPDFTAREKTYQQIHQIIGRVARGHRDGTVVIQTYNPKSELLHAAITKNYEAFYKNELKERQVFLYPPFCYLLQITCTKKQNTTAKNAAEQIVTLIKSLPIQAQIIGPSPAFKFKASGNYHWQIIIKSKQRNHLLQIIDHLPKDARYDIDPINLL